MAAVSARKIVEPREAGVHPACQRSRNSSSAQPPSGPIARTISLRGPGEDIAERVSVAPIRPARSCGIGARVRRAHAVRREHGFPAGQPGGIARRPEEQSFASGRRVLPRRSQVRIGTASDYRDNSRDSQLGAFLDGPLHAVELENGEQQGDVRGLRCGHFFAQFEFDSALFNGDDMTAPHHRPGGDIEVPARRERAARERGGPRDRR